MHIAIGTHFVERCIEPELVHESEGRPHDEADLGARSATFVMPLETTSFTSS